MSGGPPFWKKNQKIATALAQSCMIPLFRYLLGRGIRFWLYFYDLASRSPSFWGKSSFFGKRYIHSIISLCIDFLHLWVKFCTISTIWGHTVLIFAGRKEWCPLAGRHFWGKPTRWPLWPNYVWYHFLHIFWSGNPILTLFLRSGIKVILILE